MRSASGPQYPRRSRCRRRCRCRWHRCRRWRRRCRCTPRRRGERAAGSSCCSSRSSSSAPRALRPLLRRLESIIRSTCTRASFHAPWPPRSANGRGTSAFAVKPLRVCLRHSPLLSTHTPARTSAETFAAQRTSPSAFHTRTRLAARDAARRASSAASSTSAGAVRSWPNVDVICVASAGEISASGSSLSRIGFGDVQKPPPPRDRARAPRGGRGRSAETRRRTGSAAARRAAMRDPVRRELLAHLRRRAGSQRTCSRRARRRSSRRRGARDRAARAARRTAGCCSAPRRAASRPPGCRTCASCRSRGGFRDARGMRSRAARRRRVARFGPRPARARRRTVFARQLAITASDRGQSRRGCSCSTTSASRRGSASSRNVARSCAHVDVTASWSGSPIAVFRRRLHRRVAVRHRVAAAAHAELAGDRRQRECRRDRAPPLRLRSSPQPVRTTAGRPVGVQLDEPLDQHGVDAASARAARSSTRAARRVELVDLPRMCRAEECAIGPARCEQRGAMTASATRRSVPGRSAQVQVGAACQRRTPRIDDDELRAGFRARSIIGTRWMPVADGFTPHSTISLACT